MTTATNMDADWALLPGDHPQWYLDAYPLSYMPESRVQKGPISAAEFAAEIGAGNGVRKTGIYIHVPFCKPPCGYCVLVKRPHEPALADAFIKALHAQMHMMADSGMTDDIECVSVFFGGGTPTTLPAIELVRLLHAFPQVYDCSAEFKNTLEANPGTCDQEYLNALYQGGFRRISFGMQTFDPQINNLLQCGHKVDQGRRAVEYARRAGFSNINIDMMYGLPGQGTADLVRDMDEALGLGLECYTFYPLAIYAASRLSRKIETGQVPPPAPREVIDEMTDAIEARFLEAGYERSWLNQYIRSDLGPRPFGLTPVNYLALGSGAYGTFRGWTYFVNPDLDEYIGQTGQSLLAFHSRGRVTHLEWTVRKFYDAYLRLNVPWRDFTDEERRLLSPLLHRYSSLGLWTDDGKNLVPTTLGRRRADGFIQRLLVDSIQEPPSDGS